MKFSIILPVRNGGAYIKECVQSILAQTYTDFNLIILENCSTDGTAEWLKTLTDNRIVVIPADKPLSIEENWARILSIPKNEFMTMIGHDDLLGKDYLKTVNALIEKESGASLYQTHFDFIDARGEIFRPCKPMAEKQFASEFLHALFIDSIDTMGTGYMMRSEDYNHIGGMPGFPDLMFADHVLWIKLSALSYKATASEKSFLYRVHDNVSKNARAVKYINAFYCYMDFLVEFKNKNQQASVIIEDYITDYILYYCRSLSHRLLRTKTNEREGMTVTGFINNCIKYNSLLTSKRQLHPEQKNNIRLAKLIDDYFVTRNLYLFFKKIYNKPIYS